MPKNHAKIRPNSHSTTKNSSEISAHHHQQTKISPHYHRQPQSARKILVTFLLNLSFSIYEFIGGTLTGSTAITSDAIHDFGDALSIGLSYWLERKSRQRPDANYTYGYLRYSLMGGMITTLILLVGSVLVIVQAIERLCNPVTINYDGMLVLAVVGVIVNFLAAWYTHGGHSLNQKSVNLHMLEDVLGWIVVLIGAIIMRFTNFAYLDPILSIAVAIFIFYHACRNFFAILDILLEKTPTNISIPNLKSQLCTLSHVQDIHHIHVWSLDSEHHYLTMHVITDTPTADVKCQIKSRLAEQGITHSTIEFEAPDEKCHSCICSVTPTNPSQHHHV